VEDTDADDMVNKDADEAMKDAAPPGASDLPPEYQAVLAAGYDEDAPL
jgi:hypothetical protein